MEKCEQFFKYDFKFSGNLIESKDDSLKSGF